MCFCFFSDQFITDAKLVYAFGGSYYGKDSRIVGRRTAERENNHGPCLGQQIITATHTVGRSQLICKYCRPLNQGTFFARMKIDYIYQVSD